MTNTHFCRWRVGVAVAAAALVVPLTATVAEAEGPTTTTQDRLLDLAAQAQTALGGSFTSESINLATAGVDVYAVDSPATRTTEASLAAAAPGAFTFHAAAFTLSQSLAAQDAVASAVDVLAQHGVIIADVAIQPDGRLDVGLSTTAASPAVQSAIDAFAGSGRAIWHPVALNTTYQLSYRTNDSSPWNGGDAILMGGGATIAGCSAGVPVRIGSTSYMLTAAHCWEGITNTLSVRNYIRTDGAGGVSGSGATIGSRYTYDPSLTTNKTTNPTTDTALINARSSHLIFNGAPTVDSKATLIGYRTDVVGAQVCASGAYSGQKCRIQITSVNNVSCSWQGTPNIGYSDGPGECTKGITYGTQLDGAPASGNGDSGGPIYSYSGTSVYAQGMIDIGVNAYNVPCQYNAIQGRTCSSHIGWVSMPTIMNKWGVVANS